MNKMEIIASWQELPWNEIKRKANKHLPKFVFVLLIVLLVQTLAELTWAIFVPSEKETSTISSSLKRNYSTAVRPNLSSVSSYHLFGNAKKQALVQQKVIDAPETRLRLDLKGVFASTKASEALAIIASGKAKDKTYRIGDKVVGGAVLHAVYDDRVILKRNGKLETLSLPKSKVDSKTFYTSPSASNTRLLKNTVSSSSPSQSQQLQKMRDTLLNDPAKIWQQIRINPVMKNGQVQGYTLAHNDQKLMKALNLRKTDIITAVNGQSLSDPATLYGLMASISEQSTLELSIVRDGQPQVIQLSF